MARTARDFINLAMKQAGVLGVGQTLLAEDANDGLTMLNMMLSQWQQSRWLVPSLYEVSALANSQKSNTIGPGGYYNAPRPDKIQAAWITQNNNAGQNNVSFPLIPIWSYEDYALLALKQLNSWPQYIFYDNAFPFGNVHIWPIPDDGYTVHLVCKSPIGFTVQLLSGQIETPGVGYTDGIYNVVPFVSVTGFGSGGTANVTVAGGIVTDVTILDGGDGYKINDRLSFNPADIGGTGAGLVFVVNEVTDSLDAVFNMPPEYEEAVHFNLVIRLADMYQYPVSNVTARTAKLALNKIKLSNTQIPTLRIPANFRRDRAGPYIYTVDAYGR